MAQSYFQKFVPKKKNSAIKEEFKQKKRKAKKERAAAIDERFEEKRRIRAAAREAALNTPASVDISADKTDRAKSVPKVDKVTSIENKINKAAQQKIPTNMPPAAAKHGTKEKVVFAEMPLNKFMAHCGVCSRRDAVTLIKEGKVKVNGALIIEPAFKVTEKDEVVFNGKKLFVTKNLVYILLNKPKDYITTTDDPQGRKTVLQLTKMATTERIYPVGRLGQKYLRCFIADQ